MSNLSNFNFDYAKDGLKAVAFSGGKDSLALLLAMIEKYSIEEIVALHTDHRVREKESCDEEVEFVKSVCNELGVKLFSKTLTPGENKSEEALRQLRYEALALMATENKVSCVCLGHHKLDQSESFMLHLLRGSDINGLTGMREQFEYENVYFIRPMLNIHPDDCTEMIEEKKLSAFVDPSNLENNYKRNRIRNELFPLMEDLQPGVSNRLAELSQSFKEIQNWKRSCLNDLLENVETRQNNNGELLISKKFFNSYPKPVVQDWCYKTLSDWAKGEQSISRRHVLALYNALKSENTGYWPDIFPGKVQIRVRKREIVIKFM